MIKKIKSKKIKSIYLDSILNILASIVLTLAVQIIAYPILGKKYNSDDYGVILTVMGLINTVSVSIGNSLNISRLLMDANYRKSNIEGDFNLIFWGSTASAAVVLSIYLFYFDLITFKQIILVILLTIAISFRAYFVVGFRLNISYKHIFNCNMMGLVGYVLAAFTLNYFNNWLLLFLIGELSMCLYIILNSKSVKERYQKTSLFKNSFKNYGYVFGSSIIGNLVLYMDRFLILPFLGPSLVSLYTVSSFLGKSAGIIMNPISSVLLTYYTKEESLKRSIFFQRVGGTLLITLILYLGIIFVDDYIIGFLYPDFIEHARPLFAIANLGSVILIFGNTIQPLLLQFCHEKWQIIVQLFYLITYLLLSITLMNYFGIFGFCIAVMLANLLRALLMLIIVYLSI